MSTLNWTTARVWMPCCRRTLAAAVLWSAFVSSMSSAADLYKPGPEYPRGAVVLAADGNEYRAVEPVKDKDPVTAKKSPWRLAHAAFDLTLDVPGRFATIPEAMQFIAGSTIADTAIVTVQLAPQNYEISGTLRAGHPQGRRVILKGGRDPSKHVLRIGNHDGVVVDGGAAICLEGLTLEGDTKTHNGVAASDGATVFLRRVVIKGFNTGASIGQNSRLEADGVDVIANEGYAGFHAYAGSSCLLTKCSASNRSTSKTKELTFGFAAWFSSTMECHNCKSSGWYNGYFAGHAASIDVEASDAIENVFGGGAYLDSTLRAIRSTFSESREIGLTFHQATGMIGDCRLRDNPIGLRCLGGSMIDLRDRPCEISGARIGVQSLAGGILVGVRPAFRDCNQEQEIYSYKTAEEAVFQFDK